MVSYLGRRFSPSRTFVVLRRGDEGDLAGARVKSGKGQGELDDSVISQIDGPTFPLFYLVDMIGADLVEAEEVSSVRTPPPLAAAAAAAAESAPS